MLRYNVYSDNNVIHFYLFMFLVHGEWQVINKTRQKAVNDRVIDWACYQRTEQVSFINCSTKNILDGYVISLIAIA